MIIIVTIIIISIIIIYGAPSRKSPERLQRHKDTLISSHTHTHTHTHTHARATHTRARARHTHTYTHTHTTNTCITDDGLVKTTDQYAEEKRWVFSSDLKRLKTNA